jgi:hypothetical protein
MLVPKIWGSSEESPPGLGAGGKKIGGRQPAPPEGNQARAASGDREPRNYATAGVSATSVIRTHCM